MLKVAGLGLARPTDRREADEFESTTIQISKTFPCVQTDVFLTSTLPLRRPKHNDPIRTRKPSAVERVEGQAHHIYLFHQ